MPLHTYYTLTTILYYSKILVIWIERHKESFISTKILINITLL